MDSRIAMLYPVGKYMLRY